MVVVGQQSGGYAAQHLHDLVGSHAELKLAGKVLCALCVNQALHDGEALAVYLAQVFPQLAGVTDSEVFNAGTVGVQKLLDVAPRVVSALASLVCVPKGCLLLVARSRGASGLPR